MAQQELDTKGSSRPWSLTERPVDEVEPGARTAKYVLRTRGVPEEFLLAAKMVSFGPHAAYEPHSRHNASS